MIKQIVSTGFAAALVVFAPATAFAQDVAELGAWGIETENISDTVTPGEDFFVYANEGWLDQAVIPPGRSRIGSFSQLRIRSEERVGDIITSLASGDWEQGSSEQQIGDLYSSFMDVEAMDANFPGIVAGFLDQIAAIADADDALELYGRTGFPSLFVSYVWIDDQNSDRYIFHLGQGGLGMPNRDYYLNEGEEFDAYREAYLAYITRTFSLIDLPDGAERAQAVLDFEVALAERHWTRVQTRDPVASYHLMTRDELAAFTPGLNWDRYFDVRGVDSADELVLTADEPVRATAALIQETPVEILRDHARFHFLNIHADYLSTALSDASFAFNEGALNGVDEQLPREQRAVQFVNGILDDTVGKIYAERHFPPEHREQVFEMVGYLHQALFEQLNNAPWMDEETREVALHKWSTFEARIGYPDRYTDYSSIIIRPDDAFGNIVRAEQWVREDDAQRLQEPIRDWEWVLPPQTVNAFYQPNTNRISFLAGILQPPFFDPNADAAVNFGGIGGVIGHEMGHGFDDQGSQFDGDGNLRDWWTEASRAAYDARAQGLVDQFSLFQPLDGLFVNGRLTLGENIGDHSGISMAFRAYELYLEDHGGEAPVLDGFTGEQRFFLSWAQMWRRIRTDDSMRVRVVQGPHSPAIYRVNGAVQNVDEWYDAFGIDEGDPLYLPPEERTRLWE